MTSTRPRVRLAVPLATLAVAAALFAPTLGWLASTWAVDAYYGHGPLLVVVAALLAAFRLAPLVGRSGDDGSGPAPDTFLGFALLTAGVGLHLLALTAQNFMLSSLALLVSLSGLAALAWGRPAILALRLPLLLALLAVPVPAVHLLAAPLAAGVAAAVAQVAGWTGLEVTRSGAELSMAAGVFKVGAPCSGLNSLLALGSLAVLAAGVQGGSWWKRSLMVLAALPLALLANGLRLLALLVSAEALGVERGLALFHGPVGPLAFLAGLAGVIAFGRALGCEPGLQGGRGAQVA